MASFLELSCSIIHELMFLDFCLSVLGVIWIVSLKRGRVLKSMLWPIGMSNFEFHLFFCRLILLYTLDAIVSSKFITKFIPTFEISCSIIKKTKKIIRDFWINVSNINFLFNLLKFLVYQLAWCKNCWNFLFVRKENADWFILYSNKAYYTSFKLERLLWSQHSSSISAGSKPSKQYGRAVHSEQ